MPFMTLRSKETWPVVTFARS